MFVCIGNGLNGLSNAVGGELNNLSNAVGGALKKVSEKVAGTVDTAADGLNGLSKAVGGALKKGTTVANYVVDNQIRQSNSSFLERFGKETALYLLGKTDNIKNEFDNPIFVLPNNENEVTSNKQQIKNLITTLLKDLNIEDNKIFEWLKKGPTESKVLEQLGEKLGKELVTTANDSPSTEDYSKAIPIVIKKYTGVINDYVDRIPRQIYKTWEFATSEFGESDDPSKPSHNPIQNQIEKTFNDQLITAIKLGACLGALTGLFTAGPAGAAAGAGAGALAGAGSKILHGFLTEIINEAEHQKIVRTSEQRKTTA
jgi:hypothetical protein